MAKAGPFCFPVIDPDGEVREATITIAAPDSKDRLSPQEIESLGLDLVADLAAQLTAAPFKRFAWRFQSNGVPCASYLGQDSLQLAAFLALVFARAYPRAVRAPYAALARRIWATGAIDSEGRLREQGEDAIAKLQAFLGPKCEARLMFLPSSLEEMSEHDIPSAAVLSVETLASKLRDKSFWKTHSKVLVAVAARKGAAQALARILFDLGVPRRAETADPASTGGATAEPAKRVRWLFIPVLGVLSLLTGAVVIVYSWRGGFPRDLDDIQLESSADSVYDATLAYSEPAPLSSPLPEWMSRRRACGPYVFTPARGGIDPLVSQHYIVGELSLEGACSTDLDQFSWARAALGATDPEAAAVPLVVETFRGGSGRAIIHADLPLPAGNISIAAIEPSGSPVLDFVRLERNLVRGRTEQGYALAFSRRHDLQLRAVVRFPGEGLAGYPVFCNDAVEAGDLLLPLDGPLSRIRRELGFETIAEALHALNACDALCARCLPPDQRADMWAIIRDITTHVLYGRWENNALEASREESPECGGAHLLCIHDAHDADGRLACIERLGACANIPRPPENELLGQ